ncbi:MAG: hypothetical protein EU551_04015, partial [Promethearchaeota archaeon]
MYIKNKKAYCVILILIGALFTASILTNTPDYTEKYSDDSEIFISPSSWPLNGIVVSDAVLSQKDADVCSDGSGGIIVTWMDYRTSSQQIYAQRINSSGHTLWTTDGVSVAPNSFNQDYPRICSDGQGGAIIVFRDDRTPGMTPSIYAQRLDENGTRLWGSTGAYVYADTSYWSMFPEIISDGQNGSIIIWLQDNSVSEYHIFGQRLDSAGNRLWGSHKLIYIAGQARNPKLCSDGSGGAYITWNYGDIYAQRISSSGTLYWATSGVTICDASSTQEYPEIIKDGSDNAVIVWHDYRIGAYPDIYAQRINGSGDVQWASNGIGVCTAGLRQWYPQISTDLVNGTYITWHDYRNSNYDIYAQRLNSSGQNYWASNGIAISNSTGNQEWPMICSDEVGGAIVTWQSGGDIYTQRVNETGNIYWPNNGAAICTASSTQQNPIIYPDGAEGAYIIWEDYRSESYSTIWGDLYAQRTVLPEDPVLQPISPSTDNDGIIELNWSECFGAAYYYIYRESSEINSVSGLNPITTTSGTTYSDTIPENGDYYYVIVAGNPLANSSISNCENVTASVTPSAPTLYAFTPSTDSDGIVLVNWTDEIAVTNYYVYRNTSSINNISGLNPIAYVSDSNYTDVITSNGPQYYVIVSENNLGNSSISNCETVVIGIPPGAPVLDQIVPLIDQDGIISLNWSDVINTTAYYIYRDTSNISSVNSLTPIDTVTDSNYTDLITNNGFYYYVIVATDSWANSSISNCENVTLGIPPSSPELDPIVPSVDSDGTIDLNWTDVTNATSYYIYRDTSEITTLGSLTPIDTVSDSNYTDSLTNNNLYYYVIVVSDGWANSSISNCENVTLGIPPSSPELDPIVPSVDSDGTIDLNWTDVTNATSYYIYR